MVAHTILLEISRRGSLIATQPALSLPQYVDKHIGDPAAILSKAVFDCCYNLFLFLIPFSSIPGCV